MTTLFALFAEVDRRPDLRAHPRGPCLGLVLGPEARAPAGVARSATGPGIAPGRSVRHGCGRGRLYLRLASVGGCRPAARSSSRPWRWRSCTSLLSSPWRSTLPRCPGLALSLTRRPRQGDSRSCVPGFVRPDQRPGWCASPGLSCAGARGAAGTHPTVGTESDHPAPLTCALRRSTARGASVCAQAPCASLGRRWGCPAARSVSGPALPSAASRARPPGVFSPRLPPRGVKTAGPVCVLVKFVQL